MKKILALLIAVVMLAAMTPMVFAASISSVTVAVPEISGLEMTLTKVQDKYSHEAFMFDANQTPYFFYFETGGTVSFSKNVTLSFVDLTTYETSTKDFAANTPITVDDTFTGGSLYFDDAAKGFVGFISLDDTVRAAGAAACTLDVNELAAGGGAAPAPAEQPAAPAAAEPEAAAPEAAEPEVAAEPEAAEPEAAEPEAAEPEAAEPAAAEPETAAPEAAADGELTVYFTVSVDGQILIAAEKLAVTEATVDGALKAAHAKFYPDGEAGYVAGIDATWNMFLITQCWGVASTPFVIVNGAPLGAGGNPNTADACPVKNGENLIVSTSTDPDVPALAIALTVEAADGATVVTATNWVLDFSTFTYNSSPYADAEVVDPATGASLGKTDAEGKITVTPPESGVVAVAGAAAIRVDGSAKSAEELAAEAAAAAAEAEPVPLFYKDTYELIIITVVVSLPVFIAIIINMSKQKKKDKMLKK